MQLLESRIVLSAPDVDLSSLLPANGGNGSIGVTLFGLDAQDRSGRVVHQIGDVNGDGFDDVVIGTSSAEVAGSTQLGAGETYVVFGKADWSSGPTLALASLDGTNGFTLTGIDPYDYSGRAVSGAGDINGDGFGDVLVGARYGDALVGGNAGESYVVFGKADWSASPVLNLATLNGTNGFTLFGIDPNDETGCSVSGAGDVNGDGFDDIVIGASGADSVVNDSSRAGESYVVFGKADWSASPALNLATLNGFNGFTLFGIDQNDFSGHAVSGAGDVNGDGFDDVLIGAFGADSIGNAADAAGESYVVFGKSDWSASPTLRFSELDGLNGFTLFGANPGDVSGIAVSSAGDINGDGFDDLLIGASGADGDGNAFDAAGESYVVFGKADWSASPTLWLANLTGLNGFTLFGEGANDQSGQAVSGAGDVNGDGFDDLVIGAFGVDSAGDATSDAGESYVVFGKADWNYNSTVTLAGLNGTNGFRLFGADIRDYSGFAVSGGGDVNGDGFADVLIGANRANGAGNLTSDAGETYVVFGGDFTNAVTHPGTAGTDTLTGTATANVINGGRGNDTLVGNGGADVLYGGQGDDILAVSDSGFSRIDGGTGIDVLRLDGSGLTLNLTSIADNRLTSIETVDIRGSGDNTLIFNLHEVLNLSDSTNTLLIRADSGDTILIGAGWTRGTNETIDGEVFRVYTQGMARFKVPVSVAPPEITLSISSASLLEAAGTSTVTATLSAAASFDITINLAFSGTATNGIDYTRSGTQIAIAAGNTTGTITLTGVSDSENEVNETIVVEISNAINGVENGIQKVTSTITPILAPVITAPTAVTTIQRPQIDWNAASGAATYEVWIKNQSTNVNPFLKTTTSSTSLTPVSDLGIGQYNLWLRSLGAAGESSLYTPQYNFRIKTAASFQPMAIYQTTPTPTINWNALAGAVKYDLWLDNRSTGQSQYVRNMNLTGTSWTSTASLPMGTYRAWIRGLDAAGIFANWSTAVDFHVLPGVTLTGPLNPTFDRTPTFTWNEVSGAVGYDLNLRDANTGATVSYPKNIVGTTWTQPTDLPTGPYRWQVFAVSAAGLRSQTATTVDVFVGGRPTVLTPSGSTSDTTPTFTWTAVAGAARFELFVTRTDVASPGIINLTNLTNTSYTPTTPLPVGTYRAWVRAVSTTGEMSPWSVQVDFSIVAETDVPRFRFALQDSLVTVLLVGDSELGEFNEISFLSASTAKSDPFSEQAAFSDSSFIRFHEALIGELPTGQLTNPCSIPAKCSGLPSIRRMSVAEFEPAVVDLIMAEFTSSGFMVAHCE